MPASQELKLIVDEFFGKLKQDLLDSGLETTHDWDALRTYAEERAIYLSTIVGQAGYDLALIAERDSIMLRAGISAVSAGELAEARFKGMIQGALITIARIVAMGLA